MIYDKIFVRTSCPTTFGISSDMSKFWSANGRWPTVICSPVLWYWAKKIWQEIFGNQLIYNFVSFTLGICNSSRKEYHIYSINVVLELVLWGEKNLTPSLQNKIIIPVRGSFKISYKQPTPVLFIEESFDLESPQLLLFLSVVISKQSERGSEPKWTCSERMWSFNLL